MHRYKLTFFISIVMAFNCLAKFSYAQKTCSQILDEAEDSYKAGHIYGIPALLNDCLNSGFSKQEKIQAYKLLTLSYLIIDDPIGAETSYLQLLKLDPEHKIDEENDPIELVYLSKKFKTTPIFTLTLAKVGSNVSHVSVINNYGVDNTLRSNEEYTIAGGGQFGVGAEVNLSDHFSIGLETMFAFKQYNYQNNYFNGDILDFSERIIGLDIPILLKYNTKWKNIYPFFYLGVSANLLFTSNSSLKFTNSLVDDDGNNAELPYTGPDINTKPLRNTFNRSLVFGAGIKYRIRYNYLAVELKPEFGLSNLTNIDAQYNEKAEELIFRYAYVSDDFRLNTLMLNFSFIKPLYKPRKVEKYKLKPFFKSIFNK